MIEENEYLFEFAEFRVDPRKRQLQRDGEIVPLTSKAFSALLLLVSRRGEIVCKDELMNTLWAETAVEENNLTQQISTLRKKLGEKKDDHRYIVTVPGQGYSFVAPVKRLFYEETELLLEEITKSSITIDISDGEKYLAPKLKTKPSWRWITTFKQAAVTVLVISAFLAVSFWLDSFKNHAVLPRTIVVLPFREIGAPEKDALAAGMTDTLTAKIGNIKSLTVRPLDASAEYLGQEQNPLELGEKFKVETVLAGSIQRDGDRIRVTVQILDVANRRIIWGQSFNKTAVHSFDLQDAISEEVARALQSRMPS